MVDRIHTKGWFVRGIASNVIAGGIDVDLVAGKGAELRNHLR